MRPANHPNICVSTMSLFSRPIFLLGFAVALLSLTGCVGGSDYEDTYADSSAVPAIDISPVAPPALSDESKPKIMDSRSQVWRAGHWVYEDQRFVWVPGEVITRPSPTAIWSPDRWEHRTFGWVYIHGYWQ